MSPDLLPLNLLSGEDICSSASKLLQLTVRCARAIPSFQQVNFTLSILSKAIRVNEMTIFSQLGNEVQTLLLEDSWKDLFVLTVAQWSLPIEYGE